jgi:hypothetical protein
MSLQLEPRRRISTLYPYFSREELDHRVRVVERFMNQALEQRRWHIVRRRRHEMLALQAEARRRRGAIEAQRVAS